MPGRTKANGVADEQLNRADILALNTLLPAVLSRVGRLDPILSSAIQQGVQDAIDQVELMIAAARRRNTRLLYERACKHQKLSRRLTTDLNSHS